MTNDFEKYPDAIPGKHLTPPLRPKKVYPKRRAEKEPIPPVEKEKGAIERAELRELAPAPPSITELARALKNDVDLIYEWVYSNIDYFPMWGLSKDALATQIDGRGGSIDQANLMVTLLRAAGHTANFLKGRIIIYLDSQGYQSWLGTTNTPNKAACESILETGAIRYYDEVYDGSGLLQQLSMDHYWVKVTIDGSDYVFDPSFKDYTWTNGVDLSKVITDFDKTTLETAANTGATFDTNDPPEWVQNFNRSQVRGQFNSYANQLLTWLKTSKFDASMTDIIGGRTINPLPPGPVRQTSLPNQDPNTTPVEYATLPSFDSMDNVYASYNIHIGAGTTTYLSHKPPVRN